MPLFLKQRNTTLKELMEDPDCDAQLLQNTYRHFETVNRVLSRWNRIYKRYLRPVFRHLNGEISVLDVGSGGGDVLRQLDQLAKKDGFPVSFTGVDPDSRAMAFVEKQKWPDNVSFQQAGISTLLERNRRYDVVLSNHFLHHLTESELKTVCSESEQLSKQLVVFNDIRRHDVAYAAFRTVSPFLFRNSFAVIDGSISIRRSYTLAELRKALPEGWQVDSVFPFRVVATFRARQEITGYKSRPDLGRIGPI